MLRIGLARTNSMYLLPDHFRPKFDDWICCYIIGTVYGTSMFWTLGKETRRAVNGSPSIGKLNKMTGVWKLLDRLEETKANHLGEMGMFDRGSCLEGLQLSAPEGLLLDPKKGWRHGVRVGFVQSLYCWIWAIAERLLHSITVANHQLAYLRKNSFDQALVSQHGNLLTLPSDISQHLRIWGHGSQPE